MGRKLVVYSFFAALLLFGIITGTLIAPEELTVNYIVFILADDAKQASENPVP